MQNQRNLSSLYLNREIAALEFDRRVLANAANHDIPLLERLRYLCIVSNNLDEFFEIRVAGLKEQIKLNVPGKSPDGWSSTETYHHVSTRAHEIVKTQYHLLNNNLLPELAQHGIHFLQSDEWTPSQQQWIAHYFSEEILPLLTPIGLDPAHPFPRLLNKSLNFAIALSGKDAFGRSSGIAIVQAPRLLPRYIQLPQNLTENPWDFIFLSTILHAWVHTLFPGMNVEGCYQFRVTRNSDLFVDEEEVKNLRLALQGELPQRHFGDAVRLEVADNCSNEMADFLLKQFELNEADLYRVNGPVNLARLQDIVDLINQPLLKFPPFVPGIPAPLAKFNDIFKAIRKNDILLHHPYQSFKPIIQFIETAATDPEVVAIKQTIYRTGLDSDLMEALILAARNGKEVTVVLELMARFDEEANLKWSTKLETVGAHVVYGVVGYKTHAKMAMVVRRENGVLNRYAHLGTGNYHSHTATRYTDFGLLTANQAICEDVNNVFIQLTGLGRQGNLNYLWQAPFTLHKRILEAIQRETSIARANRPAKIIAKMNALLDPEVISGLYEASQAGVKIDLIVRGMCALKPGVAGLSEHIQVRSIVGRFLEHSRIFYFYNDHREEVLLSSADWMERNFYRRIELAFPILDPKLKKRILREGLKYYFNDNHDAWEMDSSGTYRHRKKRGKPHHAQASLIELLKKENPATII
ncbi:MAG: polyphosphate kinase 1 [Proteobacteria bacterium]|nr:polyphosphate kinase 1 [Pseudomonadota bacterium]MDE3207320.1 polyphosphate kinase 1 [Pseudomonadota bacterium]